METQIETGRCPRHDFTYVPMPRDEMSQEHIYAAKCPLKKCGFGTFLGERRPTDNKNAH